MISLRNHRQRSSGNEKKNQKEIFKIRKIGCVVMRILFFCPFCAILCHFCVNVFDLYSLNLHKKCI